MGQWLGVWALELGWLGANLGSTPCGLYDLGKLLLHSMPHVPDLYNGGKSVPSS